MKIIFLDIDGVLVNRETVCKHVDFEGQRLNPFHPDCVKNLNKIIEATGAKIVVSSSWRSDNEEVWTSLLFYFTNQGVKQRPIDKTPDLSHYKNENGLWTTRQRGEEIKAWLDAHPGQIEQFVVIDDSSDMDAVRDNFVHIENGMEKGLESHHAESAILILSQPRTEVMATPSKSTAASKAAQEEGTK